MPKRGRVQRSLLQVAMQAVSVRALADVTAANRCARMHVGIAGIG